jgi:hypothetical protein
MEVGGSDETVTFKSIQKLTGKLTQKIRTLESQEGMTSEDIKYVINMVLSSFDLNELSEEDREDILSKFDFIKMEDLDKFGSLQTMLMYNFVNSFFNEEDLKNFRRFAEYNERGLITQNDLTKYKSLEDVIQQLNIAEIKVDSKGLENEIVKVFEDDEWLLVRPLTYLASKKYGSNTKWCTTQSDNPEYFLKYTKKGVLIYCINKVTGYKVASFYSLEKNDPEFSFWNQKDAKIDSLDSELTDELRKIIQTVSKGSDAKTNRFLLSDDQRIKEENFLKKGMKNINLYNSGEPQPSQPEPEVERTRRGRIGEAIRRENMEQERQEEREYEDRENQENDLMEERPSDMMDVTERVESVIDRMTWSSSTTTTEYEDQTTGN